MPNVLATGNSYQCSESWLKTSPEFGSRTLNARSNENCHRTRSKRRKVGRSSECSSCFTSVVAVRRERTSTFACASIKIGRLTYATVLHGFNYLWRSARLLYLTADREYRCSISYGIRRGDVVQIPKALNLRGTWLRK